MAHIRGQNIIGASVVAGHMANNHAVHSGPAKDLISLADRVWVLGTLGWGWSREQNGMRIVLQNVSSDDLYQICSFHPDSSKQNLAHALVRPSAILSLKTRRCASLFKILRLHVVLNVIDLH